MDAESHRAVLKCMFEAHPDSTMIIVTHHEEGLELFDRRFVVTEGKLSELRPGDTLN
jgi:ATP-binding cassette, subfamily C (CFTR/MRP), member 1